MKAIKGTFLIWLETLTHLRDHHQKLALKHGPYKTLQTNANMAAGSPVT